MSTVDIIFLNNKAMDELGVRDMKAVMHDVERVYVLNRAGDVIAPGKCVMRWGKTTEDENTLGGLAPAHHALAGGDHVALVIEDVHALYVVHHGLHIQNAELLHRFIVQKQKICFHFLTPF